MRTDWRRVTWPLGAVLCVAIATAVHAQDTGSSGGLLSSLTNLFSSGSSNNSPNPGASSSLLSQQQSVIASNIQQDAEQCATGSQPGTIGYAIQQAQNAHLQLASVRPNTDALFSVNNNCFTGLSQLFDLSFAIPTLGSILSSAEQAVVQYAKQQVCQAVGQVTSQVTTPLNQAITSVSNQYGASGINGMVGQQMSTVDPNLGSAWNGNATTNGSYTVNSNTFGANQSSFNSSSGPVQTGTTTSGVPVMSGTGVSVSNTPLAVPPPKPPSSTTGRLLDLLK